MAKKNAIAKINLQIPAGQATPAPPVGPALGEHKLNIMDFCKKFNEATKGEPNHTKVSKITTEQVRRIAERKLPDLNTYKMDSAIEIIKGTARNMGVEVVES